MFEVEPASHIYFPNAIKTVTAHIGSSQNFQAVDSFILHAAQFTFQTLVHVTRDKVIFLF